MFRVRRMELIHVHKCPSCKQGHFHSHEGGLTGYETFRHKACPKCLGKIASIPDPGIAFVAAKWVG